MKWVKLSSKGVFIDMLTGVASLEFNPSYLMEQVGKNFGLYYEKERGERVTLDNGVLVIQEDTSHHGSPIWETKRVFIQDPEKIQLYFRFNELLKDIKKLEEQDNGNP